MTTSARGQIDSAKVLIREVFSRFWFCIPDYQRSYVWGKDEISELIGRWCRRCMMMAGFPAARCSDPA
jgi:hypothetical protein